MKKIIMILGICLCLNVYAEELNTLYNGTWDLDEDLTITSSGQIFTGSFSAINAGGSAYFIINNGIIDGAAAGIHGALMSGNISNYGTIYNSDYGIRAMEMKGYITNEGILHGSLSGVDATGMIGDIINQNGGHIGSLWGNGIIATLMEGNIFNSAKIDGYSYGILASSMVGSIYNSDTIYGYNSGIFAPDMKGDIINYLGASIGSRDIAIDVSRMVGNIINDGDILGESGPGIYAHLMIGNIINNGEISSESGLGIYALGMKGNIINYGLIKSDSYDAIRSKIMIGDIYNYGTIQSGGELAIDAYQMIGNIINHSEIAGAITGIEAYQMEGNITNYGDIISLTGMTIYSDQMSGTITNYGLIKSGSDYGIGAKSMSGDIYNFGRIESNGYEAIYARTMTGDIENDGDIYAFNEYAINASGMTGDIINNANGSIVSSDYAALYLANFGGTLYNYGLIENLMLNDGNSSAILAHGTFNLVGNGTIIGDIKTLPFVGTDIINITNDTDNVLDLSDARLVDWDFVNLLDGEIIIGDINAEWTKITQEAGSYVHFGRDNGSGDDVLYSMNGGTLNPYDYQEGTSFGYIYVSEFYAEAGTIEIDFGEDGQSDFIIAESFDEPEGPQQQDHYFRYIGEEVTLSFIPHVITEKGWSEEFHIFTGIQVSDDVRIKIPLLYSAYIFAEIEEPEQRPEFEDAYPGGEVNFSHGVSHTYVEIEQTSNYSDYADYYNQGVAKFLDNANSEEPEERENLMLALLQVYTADELNDLLEPYNMVGYASLANNNISWINTRTNHLFGILGSSTDSETSAANSSIGSSYATANTDLSRDANGNNVWFNVYMNDTTLDGKAGYEIESDGYEAAFGIDKQISDTMILGLALNISAFESDVTGGLPVSVESDGFGLNAYGQLAQGKFTHKAIIGYTGYENEATRAGAKADFDSSEFYAAYRIEYLIEKKSCNIVPIAGLQYSHITYDDIIEDGSNAGLAGYDYDSLQSEFGVKLIKQFNALKLDAGVSWLHELMDTETDAKAVSGIGSYSQEGIERDEDLFRLSIGVDYQISERINIGLDYAKEFGSNTDSDSINAKVSFAF